VLLPSDTHRKPVPSITAVLLPFVTCLLNVPRSWRKTRLGIFSVVWFSNQSLPKAFPLDGSIAWCVLLYCQFQCLSTMRLSFRIFYLAGVSYWRSLFISIPTETSIADLTVGQLIFCELWSCNVLPPSLSRWLFSGFPPSWIEFTGLSEFGLGPSVRIATVAPSGNVCGVEGHTRTSITFFGFETRMLFSAGYSFRQKCPRGSFGAHIAVVWLEMTCSNGTFLTTAFMFPNEPG
jgi:hypothetical protein